MPDIDSSTLTGLQWLRHNKELPFSPRTFDQLLQIQFEEIEYGRVAMSLLTQPDFANMVGSLQGGVYATMLDMAMGCSVHSTLEVGSSYATLSLNVNYVRPVPVNGEQLHCVATVVNRGNRIATADGKIHDSRGKLVSHGSTSCYISA